MANKTSNYPNVAIDRVEKGTAKEILTKLKTISPQPNARKVQNIDDLINSFENTVQMCIDTDTRLGIETVCYGLGITRMTFNNWVNGVGCDKEWQSVCVNIKQFIGAYLEQISMSGKINPAMGIWLGKQWLGYKDNIEVIDNTADTKKELSIAELKEYALTVKNERDKSVENNDSFVEPLEGIDVENMQYI